MIVEDLKNILVRNKQIENREYIRNLLKEAIQLYVLNFVYTSLTYKNLIFTGGTCLRRFYGLPRLSEDLDFDIEEEAFPFGKFKADLEDYFIKDWQYKNLQIKFREKNKTFFLRFPLLKEIGFASNSQTNVLFVRLDFAFNESKNFKTEKQLLSTYNFSFLVRTYDFPTLFANKINAFLTREFRSPHVFDLVWMLQRSKELSLKPNFGRLSDLTGIKDEDKVRRLIDEKSKKIGPKALYEDLKGFFADLNFVEDFCQNFKQLITESVRFL